MVLNLPSSCHVAVRHTSIKLVGELADWIEKHPEYLGKYKSYSTVNSCYRGHPRDHHVVSAIARVRNSAMQWKWPGYDFCITALYFVWVKLFLHFFGYRQTIRKTWRNAGVTFDGLASHPEGVAILLVTSCYGNRNKLQRCGPLGLCPDFSCQHIWFTGEKKLLVVWTLVLEHLPWASTNAQHSVWMLRHVRLCFKREV